MGNRSLVVTSIAAPTAGLRELAAAAQRHDMDFIVIGDAGSPPDFELDGCDFYSLEQQAGLELETARICPVRHYARKNVGYLLAMARGAETIVETDDDTVAYDTFWTLRERSQLAEVAAGQGWVNVYRYFSETTIWPRGLPLDEARAPAPPRSSLSVAEVIAPIQQGLVDNDPDVDAVFRLVLGQPFRFDAGESIALPAGAWCPFNSQNTTWWPEAYPLMYLPAHCSFRMTDIWRSFIAQRIAWTNDWAVLFHAATVAQERNAHDLMRDFEDELPGYLANRAICVALEQLDLVPGAEHVAANMRHAYRLFIENGWLDEHEFVLLDAWLADVAAATRRRDLEAA